MRRAVAAFTAVVLAVLATILPTSSAMAAGDCRSTTKRFAGEFVSPSTGAAGDGIDSVTGTSWAWWDANAWNDEMRLARHAAVEDLGRGLGEGHALALAAREHGDGAAGQGSKIGAGKRSRDRGLVPRGARRAGMAEPAQGDDVLDAVGEGAIEMLRHIGPLGRHRLRAQADERAAIEVDPAAGRAHGTADCRQQCRLAGTIRSHHDENAA